MNKGKKGKTMTTSCLTKRKSMPLLKKTFFVFAHQLGCIIEIFYIIPPVAFWAIAVLANNIFND